MNGITFTYSYNTPGILKALSVVDITLSLFLLIVILFFLFLYRNTKQREEYKYFLPFFIFKVTGLLAFTFLYIYNYGGGDSVAFWSGANSLVDLSLVDFPAFLREIFNSDPKIGYINEFMLHGIPYPSWIVREPEGYFTSKIVWFFNLISGKNFLLTSIYFMLFSFMAHWKLYQFIVSRFKVKIRSKFHLFFLFIPSVTFWCTGISKDTLVLVGILSLTRLLLKWFLTKERSIGTIFWMIFYSWLLIKTREITFVLLIMSFGMMWLFTLVNSVNKGFVRGTLRFSLMLLGGGIVLVGFYAFGLGEFTNNYLNEASVVAQDFTLNDAYTGAKYDLGISDFSYGSLLKAVPMAVIAGLFRPFIWESFSATLILNGIEGSVLMYFLIKNVFMDWRRFTSLVFNHKLLLYAAVFAMMFAFSTGLTAVIFGVLVRLRAPLLVFLIIVIFWREFRKGVISQTVEEIDEDIEYKY